MNLSKIIIIVIALVVAVGAMMLSQSLTKAPKIEIAAPVVEKVERVEILLAAKTMQMGDKITYDSIAWRQWPKDMITDNMILNNDGEDMLEKAIGSVVKIQIDEGDPIRFSKIVDPKNGGLLSAILAPGMRAISTPISPETGAGGFILPNDKVDVMLTKEMKNGKTGTATILSNIKVLAIDQTIREEDGQQVVVGRTATLELNLSQSEALALANNEGSLTLSLRSLADRNITEAESTKPSKKLTILRHGRS